MTLPRDIFTGKMPAVYNSILSREGVLIPMQQDMAGNVLAHYPDGTTRSLTTEGSVDFTHDGQIPCVAGDSPVATFNASADKLQATIPAGDRLQMSGGGSWVFLLTIDSIPNTGVMMQKTSNLVSGTRQGYGCFYRTNGQLALATSNNTFTASLCQSAVGLIVPGERVLIIMTLNGTDATLYKNGTLVGSQSGMQSPTNISSLMAVGNSATPTAGRHIDGSQAIASVIPAVLTASEIQTIAAQCGLLG